MKSLKELEAEHEDDAIYHNTEELVEDDEISPMEAAFMKGYDEAAS